MDSRARVGELAQRFLVERPKELERASGFVQRSTAQTRTGSPSAQAPQGECKQTAPPRMGAGAHQRRESAALGPASRGAHALALANRTGVEALQAGRSDRH